MWIGVRYDQPLTFFLVILAVPTLIASVLFLVARFRYEHWAKAHPEVVEHVLNTPEVQDVLEQEQQGV